MAIQMTERPAPKPARMEPVIEPSRWLIGMGVATIVLGFLAIALAFATTMITVMTLGAVIIAAAVFQAVFAFTSGRWAGFGTHLLLAVLYGVVGVYLVANPLGGAIVVTLAMGLLFAISGLFRVVASVAHRFAGWGWALFSGLVSTALGVYVLRYLPGASLFLLGTVLGVDLIFFGVNLTASGIDLRNAFRR